MRMPRTPAAGLPNSRSVDKRVIRVHGRRERRIALIPASRDDRDRGSKYGLRPLRARCDARSRTQRPAHHAGTCSRSQPQHRYHHRQNRSLPHQSCSHHQRASSRRANGRSSAIAPRSFTRRRFMMNHNARIPRASSSHQSAQDQALHPLMLEHIMRDPILRRDLRNPLAINTVLDHEQLAVLRHERRDHAFDRGRARFRHQHGRPPAGSSYTQQRAAHAPHPQIEEFASRWHRSGCSRLRRTRSVSVTAGVQQQHQWPFNVGLVCAAPMCRIRRVLTSTGVTVGRAGRRHAGADCQSHELRTIGRRGKRRIEHIQRIAFDRRRIPACGSHTRERNML